MDNVRVSRILNRIKLINITEIPGVCQQELDGTETRTIFLFNSQDFEKYWSIIKTEMRQSGGKLKFAHNQKVQDSHVDAEEGLWIRPRLDPQRPHEQ